MNAPKTRLFIFDRRDLLKITGVYGAASFLLRPEILAAEDMCKEVVLNPTTKTESPGEPIHIWVDGLHFDGSSDIPSRANIALWMNVDQTDASFVESVILADPNGKVLGSRYFDASEKTSTGKVPYVVFENLDLSTAGSHRVFYMVRVGTETKLYVTSLGQIRRSVLNHAALPETLRQDMINHIGDTPGLVSVPYQYYTFNGLSTHCARGFIKSIGSDGTFKIDIEYMHGDASPEHYMRYFMVCDPVGRILGLVKRRFGDTATATGRNGSAPAMEVKELSAAEITSFNLDAGSVAKIQDCPYIQIYTEDVYDALARSTIRLR